MINRYIIGHLAVVTLECIIVQDGGMSKEFVDRMGV